MSGIYIKGMEIPTSCAKCKLFGEYGCPFIGAVGYALTMGKRNEDCPLVPVPPHGRLIDADEADSRFTPDFTELSDFQCGWNAAMKRVCEDAPTIIPAELPVHHGTFAAASEKEALERIIPAEEGE